MTHGETTHPAGFGSDRCEERELREVPDRNSSSTPLTSDLRHTERLYRTLIESLPQQVFFKDRDSRFVSVNAAFARDFSREPAEFVGKSDADFFPRELASKYQADDDRVMASRRPSTFEEKNVVCGRTRYVEVTKAPVIDEGGDVIGLLGIFTDITERRLAQQEIARSKAFLDSVIENLPIMVFIKRADDLRFILWNRACAELSGLPAEEVIGKTDSDLFPPELAEAYVAADRATFAGGQMVDIAEETMLTTHRGTRLLHTKKIPVYNDHGVPEYLVGISQDITESQAAEDQLRQFAARLEQNNRELQDFAYVASHDLQEPLRKVRAFGDRLATKYSSAIPQEGRDYLNRMLGAAQRMQGLIEDLLAFSRITTRAQPFTQVDLTQVAREVVGDLEVRIEQAHGRVEIGDLPKLEADATQMRQLLQNLIGNALKFHKKDEPPVVKVSATVQAAPQDAKSKGRNGSKKNFCRLVVEDRGIGFDEKYLDRIFTVFQRLHGRGEYEGTGVGLAICRKIALRHQGEITARSEPGKGAVFIVSLPVQQNVTAQL